MKKIQEGCGHGSWVLCRVIWKIDSPITPHGTAPMLRLNISELGAQASGSFKPETRIVIQPAFESVTKRARIRFHLASLTLLHNFPGPAFDHEPSLGDLSRTHKVGSGRWSPTRRLLSGKQCRDRSPRLIHWQVNAVPKMAAVATFWCIGWRHSIVSSNNQSSALAPAQEASLVPMHRHCGLHETWATADSK
jgi:hypothetical protein